MAALAAFGESAVAFGGIKGPGMILDYAGSRQAKSNVKVVKAGVAAGEIDAKTISQAALEGQIAPDIDASKLNEILKTPEKAQAFGKRNAQNENVKASVHAKAEAIKIKYMALTEGKPIADLSPEVQKEVLALAEQSMTLNAVGEGIDAAVKEEPMVPLKEPKTPVEVMERKFAEKKAVLTKLERDSKALEAEREAIDEEIAVRIKEQRPTAALDAASSRLTQKIMANDLLAAEVQTTPTLMSEMLGDKLADAGVEGIMSAQEIVAAERNTEERIAAAKRSFFTHGAAYAKREVQRVQKYLEELVKRSGMEKEERAKFMAVIRNTQTIEQLEVNYPEIRDRIFVAEEVRRARASEQILAAALKAGKVKSVDGKATGKFGDADTQAIVTAVNAVSKMTRSNALLEMVAAEAALLEAEDVGAANYSAARHAKAHYAYQAARFRAGEMSTDQGAEFVSDLTAMMAGARAKFLAQKEAEREARLARAATAVKQILGDLTPPEGAEKSKVESGSWVPGLKVPRPLVGAWYKAMGSIAEMGHLLAQRSGLKEGESLLEKIFNASKEETRFDGLKQTWHERLTSSMESAYNFTGSAWQKAKSGRVLQRRLVERHDLGEHTNAKGQKVRLDYSLDEAIKFFLELQDPTLAQNITHPEAMAYTPQMIAEITGLLSDGDKRFAQEQLQLYRELYTAVNKVYREVRGVDLPFNSFYSPIRVLGVSGKEGGKEMDVESGADQIYARSTLGNWGISRVRHLHPLEKQSSLAAFNDHVYGVTRYIAYEAKVREWNALMANTDFKNAVIGVYGDEIFNGLKTMVQRITAGSHERAIMRGFDRFITRLIVAEIIGKPLAIAKQFTSMPAFANAVPAEHLHLFAKELGATLTQGFSKEWVNSDFVRARGMTQSQDLRAAIEYSKEGTALNDPRIVEAMATFVKFGDKASILVGGNALFRYLRSQGKSVEEALDITSQTARVTQSSGSIIDLSPLQSSGGLVRLFTAYMNQPVQFIRLETHALMAMASKGFMKGEGRMSRPEAAKTIILFHFILPSLFQAVVDFGWDEEKQKRAAILGSFNSIPLLANLVSNLYHIIAHEEGAQMGGGSVWDSWQRDIIRGVKALESADDLESFADALELLANPTFKAIWGIPTKPFFNVARGAKTIADGDTQDFIDAFKLVAGYSPYMIEEQNRR
jgi:polyhydroxyalkanoate synthesis regulator phasin